MAVTGDWWFLQRRRSRRLRASEDRVRWRAARCDRRRGPRRLRRGRSP